jgi:hypothetical protein
VAVVILGVLFTACGTIVALGVSIGNYAQSRQIIIADTAQVVEGPVEDFTPESNLRKGSESFTVKETKFEYSSAEITPGFNHTSVNGGPITENGLQVRIHYYLDKSTDRNIIVKLEIRK